ncbi:MAG: hypothetical protein C4521_07415 [Actinobacteria bacterium]|nr:MAG: hypothetical protein C4521_07415 [Actinomycetota bacterium]
MPAFLYVSAAVIALLVAASFGAIALKDRQAKRRLAALTEEYASEEILESSIATFAGRASYGSKQTLGAGPLLLTSRRLLFEMSPGRTLAISTNALRSAETTALAGGKQQALKVTFHDEKAGNTDAAVWVVQRPQEWAAKLARAGADAMREQPPPSGIILPWERDG